MRDFYQTNRDRAGQFCCRALSSCFCPTDYFVKLRCVMTTQKWHIHQNTHIYIFIHRFISRMRRATLFLQPIVFQSYEGKNAHSRQWRKVYFVSRLSQSSRLVRGRATQSPSCGTSLLELLISCFTRFQLFILYIRRFVIIKFNSSSMALWTWLAAFM